MSTNITRKYKTNYLTNVIFRIDYPEISLLKNDFPKDFFEAIKTNFASPSDRTITNYHTEAATQNSVVEKIEQKLWDFTNAEANTKVRLASNHLVVEVFKYVNFEDFAKCISEVYTAFIHSYTEQPIKRLGLRYINLVSIKDGRPFDWSNLINASLLGSLNWITTCSSTEKLRRGMSQMFFKDDDSMMTFTHGIYNSEFPAKVSRREFLLDYDCHTEDIECGDLVKKYISPFQLKINRMYEASIEEGLRTLMTQE